MHQLPNGPLLEHILSSPIRMPPEMPPGKGYLDVVPMPDDMAGTARLAGPPGALSAQSQCSTARVSLVEEFPQLSN